MNEKIPIFIIVHNHYEILKKSLASYEKFIDCPKQFIFHNTNSEYQPTLDFLKERENKGDLVYHRTSTWHLSVMDTVKDYLHKNPETKYYVLTDPDIELNGNGINNNILQVFMYLLEKYKAYSVGPSLKIDDIPDYYPKKHLIPARHNRFHQSPRIQETFEGMPFEITEAPIDTTFQLIKSYSTDQSFPHFNCIRVFEPYDARHLDWYIDPNNMTDCQKYYSENATHISHWNNAKWNGS